jgi:1-deoxy-D-xylulose-5-phosphate reductoisomerase
MKQRLTILGSTGSVGTNTLDVVARHPDRFEVFALSAATQVDRMLSQCAQFKPRYAVMASEAHGRALQEKIKSNGLNVHVLWTSDAIEMIASHESVDAVMAAIVGAAGLASCIAAARAGKRLLLANKEALVVGGQVFLDAVREGGATLLPIDSEHSAIFQCLPTDRSTWAQQVDSILLTSSGGPFRQRDPATLGQITPDQACAHPNFAMGRKISVDSATMMNKALEVIEARWLFDLAPEQIQVVIHPQQIIHSMVSWPERIVSGAQTLDFRTLGALTFEPSDSPEHRARFPGLQLAWEALRGPSGTTTVLNAANETAVAAFLAHEIRFDQIHRVILATLEAVTISKPSSLDELLALDRLARGAGTAAIGRLAR